MYTQTHFNGVQNITQMEMNTDEYEPESSNSYRKTTHIRLTPELIEKAEIEVNEKESWRERDIEALREIVCGESSLLSQNDDEFLLRFLRARMFDYDRALQLIKQYYYLQLNHPQLFVVPSKLKCVFDAHVMTMLPKKAKTGEAVFIFEGGRWNPRNYSFDTLVAGSVACMEKAILDESTQIGGIICVVDMSDFGWSQLRRFGPSQAKNIVHIIEECLPIRFKAIHVINESTLADIAFAVMKPFLTEELRNKIIFHGTDLTNLHSIISPDVLPAEIGGSQGPIDSHDWYQELLKSEEFLYSNWKTYGYKKIGMEMQNSHGIDGKALFRKSQTCNGYLFDYYKPSRAE